MKRIYVSAGILACFMVVAFQSARLVDGFDVDSGRPQIEGSSRVAALILLLLPVGMILVVACLTRRAWIRTVALGSIGFDALVYAIVVASYSNNWERFVACIICFAATTLPVPPFVVELINDKPASQMQDA